MSAAQKLRAENERLRLAIHRIAVEKGMWYVSGNNVIVSIEPTLTDAEREAITWAIAVTARTYDDSEGGPQKREALRGLLARHGGDK